MKTVPFSLIQDSETDVFMQIISKHTLVVLLKLQITIFLVFLKIFRHKKMASVSILLGSWLWADKFPAQSSINDRYNK